VLIAVPGRSWRRRLTITNSTDDFLRLIAILRESGLPVRIGFEATGNYHRVLMYHLGVASFDLKLVSSVALARTREALHNSWDKNDPEDAKVILHMLQIGDLQIFQDPMVAGRNDIQELSKAQDAVSRAKTAALAPHLDPLPAALLSGSRSFPSQLAHRLVSSLPRDVPVTANDLGPDQGGVY